MEKLQPGIVYHIFNHANGFENVFSNDDNYWFFLDKYQKYISPVTETYAWCLMPNHFHLVIRIRSRKVIEELIINKLYPNFSKVRNFGKVKSIEEDEIERFLSKQFANLFSSYTQAYNKMYARKGSLFIKNFKREPISDKTYFMHAVAYTHRNPVHHGFTVAMEDWPYSSYFGILNNENTVAENKKVLAVFGGMEGFKKHHAEALLALTPGICEIP